MQDNGNASLVVADTETIGAVAVDAERLHGEHALEVNRVHVCDQQYFLVPRALERRFDHAADFCRRVVHAVDVVTWFDEDDVAAECFQTVKNHLRNPVEPFAVAATGFDVHEIP